ncbi:Hpt domain-containing protein [Flexibacter flexilis DSM 6793]|uniref:Hpt domain-containing protein n=1 Tax=Flexibacter flexilis DSM 6793 TaxID=927664 RepID=A0A1I1FF09_9BACT|nr:response regulator [Flexibacter flexilis]SFB95650.1 Hpt domain-containing protein [Flexibacter flexilis DSM 6793]
MNTPNPLIKALISEDNLLNSYLLAQMLRRWNIAADMATTGHETISKATQTTYDIIFLDLQLPDMQGFEIAKYIRQQYSFSANTPIALTTATLNLEEQIQAQGIDAYLTKPFSLEDVANVLTQLLGKTFSTESEAQALLTKSYETIDLTYLRKLSNENIAFIRSMATAFCNQSPLFLEQLAEAADTADWETLRSVAHKMKSTVSMMGMSEADKLLNIMEDSENEYVTPNEAKQQVEQLERICQEAFVELADWRND